jgi:NAD(P)-dependent dehydrogenase (short-subunit alcohol dehydrogenase family)
MEKVAIVTGITRGFGAAFATALTQEGWHVVGDGRGPLTDAASTSSLDFVQGDICDEVHRLELADAAAKGGDISLLVNNAGWLGPSPLVPLAQVDTVALDSLFAVNVIAPLRLAQLCMPYLANGAAIVNVSSDAAIEGYENWGPYGATKAALDQLSVVMGVENPSLRVYSFDPGDMRTTMHQEAFPDEDISDRPKAETVAPALLRLIDSNRPSGRYKGSEL